MLKNKKIDIILKIIWIIVFVYLMIDIFWDKTEIPYVNIGSSVVFYDEVDKDSVITDIDATEEYIYYAYFGIDVVSAYDWNGKYQFSIAVHNEKNGAIDIRCLDDKLYIHDAGSNVFVYEGTELLETILREQTQYELSWFHKTSGLVKEQDDHLVDQNGEYVMDLPGQGEKDQNQHLLMILAMILIAGLVIVIRRSNKKL